MFKSFISSAALAFTLCIVSLPADEYVENCNQNCDQETPDCCMNQKISIGPELYFINRHRLAGSKQSGGVYGVRATYERVKPYGFYLCANTLYASGFLHGRNPLNHSIKSNYTDFDVEGRLGFTFPWESCSKLLFTPYVGYGYLEERNNYKPPSPLNLHFKIYYPYFSGGFLSSIALNQKIRLGLNFKAYAMYQAKCEVTNDPDFDDVKMLIEDEVNYRVEIPLTYQCTPCSMFGFGLVPFYEWRHYGGRINFPFDFIDTKVNIYGLNLQLILRF